MSRFGFSSPGRFVSAPEKPLASVRADKDLHLRRREQPPVRRGRTRSAHPKRAGRSPSRLASAAGSASNSSSRPSSKTMKSSAIACTRSTLSNGPVTRRWKQRMPTRRSQFWRHLLRTSICRDRWMVLNSLTRSASAGPQSNLFSRRDTLTLVMTNCPSVGDLSQSHIVMKTLFRR